MAKEITRPVPDAAERLRLLEQLQEWLEAPMLLLSFAWVLLVAAEFIWGTSRMLEVFGTGIWAVFVLEFALKIYLAPDKIRFIKSNPVGILALIAPAFRILRIFRLLRVARAARGLRLVRLIGGANRGMAALQASMRRRGLGYLLAVSAMVLLIGAGGMLAFEPAREVEGGFESYGDALWWSAMVLTSIGSEFWPETAEGRLLCFLLSLYGFAVFGYITGSFASLFVDVDAHSAQSEIPAKSELAALRQEIVALRQELSR